MSLSKRTKSILVVAMADKKAATEVSAAVDFGSAITGVTPGSYTSANITVDAQGRISAASNGSGGGGIPSMAGHAKQFLTNNGSVASWDIHLTTDITAGGAGGGGSTGLVIIGGDQVAPNTKATKLILNNVDGGSNWSLVNFDSTHGPGQGYFAITSEGNGQALYADPDNLEVTMPSGAYLGNILSSTGGQLKFFNTVTSPTFGYVWTCTGPDGAGDWQPASGGGSSVLANDVYLKGRNAANNADLDIVRISSSDLIELGHPSSSEGIQIQSNMIDIWGSHTPNAGEVWIHSALTRLYNPPGSSSSPLLLFGNAAGTFGTSVRASASLTADMTLTLPDNTGTSGQVLTTDGSGIMSWTSMFDPGAIPSDLVFSTGVVGVLKTKDNPGGNTTNLTISTGLPSAGVSQSGDLNLLTALSLTPGSSSGAINIISGASGNSGIITIRTGNSSTASGDLNLITGTAGGTHGKIVFVDGTEGTAGHVWTSTNNLGTGSWAAAFNPSAISTSLVPTGLYDVGSISNNWSNVYSHSLKSDSGLAINSAFNFDISAGGGVVSLIPNGSVATQLVFWDATQTNAVRIKSPNTLASNQTYQWPQVDGSSGYVLSTDGAGLLSWTTNGGPWSTSGNDIYNVNSGNAGINTGATVPNQFTVNQTSDTAVGSTASYGIALSNGSSTNQVLTFGADVTTTYIQSWQNLPLTINNFANGLILQGMAWPNADGTSGQVLQTDGAGVLSWTNGWQKFTLSFSDFTGFTGQSQGTVPIVTLPSGFAVIRVMIRATTGFLSPSVTNRQDWISQVGATGTFGGDTLDRYISGLEIGFDAPATDAIGYAPGGYASNSNPPAGGVGALSFSSGKPIALTIISNTADTLDQLTDGSVDIWIKMEDLNL